MKVERLFPGIYRVDGRLATVNLVKGARVYGEDLLSDGATEYRSWNPYRSKLAAAILKGLKRMAIKRGASVLYLGASTGTTASHVSDVVGADGSVYCIEISERSMRDLIRLCDRRHNLFPILKDARSPESYASEVGLADLIYMDVSARDQDSILLRNSELLKKGGYAYVAIKSQSIDVGRNPELVFKDFLKSVSSRFEVIEEISIEPFDRMHLFVVLRKR
jgi:fibrillarin-like pre-rRNA processing protein